MTVAPVTPPRVARWYSWIPRSWYANGGQDGGDRPDPRNDHRVYRDRDRDRDIDLDDTRSFRRRYDDIQPPSQASPKFQIPAGAVLTLVLYLIGQLIAGVWWGATQQANLQHEIMDRAKEEQRLWESVQTYRLEVQALRVEIARSGSKAGSRKQNNDEEE